MALTQRTCHNCGLELELPSAAPGTIFTCPECNAEIVAGIRSARPMGRSPARPGPRRGPPRRSSAPTGLIVAAIVVVAVLAGAFFALSRSGDPGPGDLVESDAPIRTTFDEVSAGGHAPGARVVFKAVIYPGSLIQISGTGETRHFTLAVPPDSDILRRVRDLARRANNLLLHDLGGLEVFVENDDRLAGPYEKFDKFMEEVELSLRIRDGDRAIAVEIGAFDELAEGVEWQRVGGLFDASPEMSNSMDSQLEDILRATRGLNEVIGAAGIPVARKLIDAMADVKPPDLGTDLPDVEPYRPDGSDQRELNAFNQLIDAYNSELIRRRKYQIQRMKETCLFYRATLEGFLRDGPRDLVAEVQSPPALAAKTFDHDVAYRPKIFVKEEATPGNAFATRHYKTATVLVSSYPAGATASVDGQTKGKTPLLLTGLVPGKDVQLSLSLTGHRPASRSFTPRLRPNTPVWLCRLLWPVE